MEENNAEELVQLVDFEETLENDHVEEIYDINNKVS
jgi:hypothetical protein